jgi:peptidoglycan biosynthesis protein MviN/MurJ (putative lipid II flippase)
VVGFTLGLGLKFVGFNLGGIRGLAIATSTYYSINASVLYLLMRRKIRAARQVRQPAAGETVSPERSNALDV